MLPFSKMSELIWFKARTLKTFSEGFLGLNNYFTVTDAHILRHWVSYLFIGSPASGHKHYVETSEASNRDEEQACNTHYSQPESTGVKE